jgi:hypothetical protein
LNSFLDCFFFQFYSFPFDFVLFLCQIWYSFLWLSFFTLFSVCFYLSILPLNISFHFFFLLDGVLVFFSFF